MTDSTGGFQLRKGAVMRKQWQWNIKAAATQHRSNSCPVPKTGTGRYKFNSTCKETQLKLAVTKTEAKFQRD